jgi:hypothetical protein
VRGVQKYHQNIFAKSPYRKRFPKKSTKISMSVPPRLFLFYRVLGCFSANSDGSSKTLQKNVLQKNREALTKKSTKTHFFPLIFFSTSVDGGLNPPLKNIKTGGGRGGWPWHLTHLPTTRATDFFWVLGGRFLYLVLVLVTTPAGRWPLVYFSAQCAAPGYLNDRGGSGVPRKAHRRSIRLYYLIS